MNVLSTKVLDYLLVGGAERKKALKDLVGEGILNWTVEADTKRELEKYLQRNTHGFCADGIQRFRKAVGLNPSVRKGTFTVEVELSDRWNYSSSGQIFDTGSLVARNIANALTSVDFGRTKGEFVFKNVKIAGISKGES